MDRLVLVLSSCVMAAAFRLPSSYQTSWGSKHEPSFLGRHLGWEAGCATPPPQLNLVRTPVDRKPS